MNAVNLALDLYSNTKNIKVNLCDQPAMIAKLGEGWVGEEALSISLFCSLMHEQNFAEGVLMAVNHSGDSDSTGSITGNILGLINAIEAIPANWINKLQSYDIVEETAKDLYIKFRESEFNSDDEWSRKYPPY